MVAAGSLVVAGAAPAGSSDVFPDVADDNPFHDDIAWMADLGITEGFPDGTYRPNAPVTRQAMAAFLHRLWAALGAPDPDPIPDHDFTDVDDTNPFDTDIAWMAHLGLTEGYPDGTYRPNDPVTRQAMAAFLHRLWAALGADDPDPIEPHDFTDVSDTNPFDTDIAWMAHLGLTEGFPDGTYRPTNAVLRQAMAAFLHRVSTAFGFVVDTAADTPDAAPGDGVCADDTGACSLRAAIDEANALSGADTIWITAGVDPTLAIAGPGEDANATGDLDVTDDLTIRGRGATIDADRLDRLLDTTAPLTVTDTTLTRGEVRSSTGDTPRGGAIRATAPLTLTNTTITNNRVENDTDQELITAGGGIDAPTVHLTDSTISNNKVLEPICVAALGGGIRADHVTIERSTITGNRARGLALGGGLMTETIAMTDSEITDNAAGFLFASSLGGGLYAEDGSIADSKIADNAVVSSNPGSGNALGGGIGVGGDLTIERTEISGNAARHGGGVFAFWGAGEDYGASDDGGHLDLIDATIAGNTAAVHGGGMSVVSSFAPGAETTASIERTAITGNEAVAGGGLSSHYLPALAIGTSTISDNRSLDDPDEPSSGTGQGGGLYLVSTSAALQASTVTANDAARAGSGLAATEGSALTTTSSVIADQSSGDDCHTVDGTTPTTIDSQGHNLDSDGTCGLDDPTDQPATDPLLGPLADNGGPTLTHLPLAGSPLIDQIPMTINGCGDQPDQRGVPRPQGTHCDIGAVERQP
ncbi:MAG: S-layer homology domain-containing protein [Acidimicrobiia bacterium]|nr:S-layer homology domain-containing protein [Acidimicrobiia bacterium]